ncbi:MAG: D-3-phosphoglycerate dehydrogenase [Pseudomonadota bacterium]
MKKILISDKLAQAGIEYLNQQPDIQIHQQTGLNEAQLCEIIGDYDALLIRSDTKVTKTVLQVAKKLQLIGRAGIGVDNVDIPTATELGIIVMNTPDSNATTTAELALAHIFSSSRSLPTADRSVRAGKWERSKFMGSEVAYKTLAILGFGTIGRIVANRGLGLKMRVIAYDPFVNADIFEQIGVESVSLEQLLQEADYLTLHCPLIEKTRNIIGEKQLAMMKPSARIINCARGGLIDEAALYQALSNGRLAGAALDVFAQEPPKESPLLSLDNLTFTPHLGASTHEAQVAVSVEIARQAVTFFRTGEAVNALNLPRVPAEQLKKSKQYIMLANILGQVMSGLASKPIQRLEVSAFGKAAEVDIRPISTETFVGLFSGQASTPVNSVNAGNIAKSRGIALVESKTEQVQGYLSLLKIVAHAGQDILTLEGTLLGDCHPRLVKINQFEIEVVPEGTLLITRHHDKPGVIGAISTVLGKADINITRMQVSIADENQQAMAVISVSQPLADEIVTAIGQIPAICQLTQIHL